MSETQKSVMGPRRLFILLALGAGVFYFLADSGEVEESEENTSNIEAVEDLDLGDDSITLTVEEEITNSTNNTKNSVTTSLPQTSAENDEYRPQSSGNSAKYRPQSSGNNDGYTPQSAQ